MPRKLITIYNKITSSVDTGRTVDVVYLDFSKAFNAVSHCILLDNWQNTDRVGSLQDG